jgi:predicted Zn-ribbon and HTH transcriptional regulator
VNPDEIVAMGAALQGAILKGISKDVLLLDVTPLSLGVKTYGGAFTRVIEANTTIPTTRSLVFSTVEDMQEEVEISVYQGEHEAAEKNKLLGKFTLTGIKPGPRGSPRIEVTFSYNINGILKVSAVDLSTKSQNEVVVSQSGLLSKETIDRLRQGVEKYKESDSERKELIKKKNDILRVAYFLKKNLGNVDCGLETENLCKSLIEEAETAVEKENVEEMEKILDKLTELHGALGLLEDKKFPKTNEIESKKTRETVRAEEEKLNIKENFQEKEIKDKDLEKEALEHIQSIEKYMQRLTLEPEIIDDCSFTIQKARQSIAAGDNEGLQKIVRGLKEMDYNLGLIATYSVDGDGKSGLPDFDTHKLRRSLTGFDTQKVQIGVTGIEEKKKESEEKEGSFDLNMFDDIKFKKGDTKPIKIRK